MRTNKRKATETLDSNPIPEQAAVSIDSESHDLEWGEVLDQVEGLKSEEVAAQARTAAS